MFPYQIITFNLWPEKTAAAAAPAADAIVVVVVTHTVMIVGK